MELRTGCSVKYGILELRNGKVSVSQTRLRTLVAILNSSPTRLTVLSRMLPSFTVDGENFFGQGATVVADTGTSWINVPDHVARDILKNVDAEYDAEKDMYLLNHCKTEGLPSLTFNIGGRAYPLAPEGYLLPV